MTSGRPAPRATMTNPPTCGFGPQKPAANPCLAASLNRPISSAGLTSLVGRGRLPASPRCPGRRGPRPVRRAWCRSGACTPPSSSRRPGGRRARRTPGRRRGCPASARIGPASPPRPRPRGVSWPRAVPGQAAARARTNVNASPTARRARPHGPCGKRRAFAPSRLPLGGYPGSALARPHPRGRGPTGFSTVYDIRQRPPDLPRTRSATAVPPV